MATTTFQKLKWFWPWQDQAEEAWLEKMSQEGNHLQSVQLPCTYIFSPGEARQYTYRLDYIRLDKAGLAGYLQLFQDAGWEYLGEMSNWRYWRKLTAAGETPEIFTDPESKLNKYKRMLVYLGFFLFILVFLGTRMYLDQPWTDSTGSSVISAIYLFGICSYAVVISLYIVVVVQLLRRVSQLKKESRLSIGRV